ncbi:MFS transporter [Methylobrevis pamukkalensis]|uniref:Fosmidomycin resistance protein n=1 Tax=Methylobrevis pamukkalensis TaxID=1439726 RepID=A0A1E3H730_9HYPH|nr:MFS transporter [Methylobrevis pamukkalensis]ODN71576.1 Fosmidomycin resistance protein [Methylobrevis pamukkalensis]
MPAAPSVAVSPVATPPAAAESTTFLILAVLAAGHLVNDMMQSLVAAIYPVLKVNFALDFGQIGVLTMSYQITASLLQPVIGLYTDRRPLPYALFVGMGFITAGLLLLAAAPSYGVLLVAAVSIGIGSAIFHPDASRMVRLASGGRHGLAQSLFQVGGNFGTALGPLAAALVVLTYGQSSVAWFAVISLGAMAMLWKVGGWYKRTHLDRPAVASTAPVRAALPKARVVATLFVLGLLVFSKFVYTSSFTSYYTFYLIERFGLSVESAQLHLFAFLGAVAAGTILGGPIGDRIGRRIVIWVSILGVLPFTLLLPHVDLWWTGVLSVVIGVVLASAFPAIVVYAQELVPGRVGMVAGMFFGFAFGVAGIAAATLGEVADAFGIAFVYQICAFLPAIGLLTVFLPDVEGRKRR